VATVHPKKLKESTTIGSVCKVLNNFMKVLVFGISKFE